MDKSWRPPNWEDIKFHRCMDLTEGGGSYGDIYEVFEAGADAMLDSLFKLAGESPTRTFTINERAEVEAKLIETDTDKETFEYDTTLEKIKNMGCLKVFTEKLEEV